MMKNVFFSLLFSLLIISKVKSQTTYTWNAGNGAWNVGANWSPNGVPGDDDQVIFDNGASQIVSGVSANISLRRLSVTGNTTVTLQHTANRTLTIDNWFGTDMTIEAGSTLILGNGISITLNDDATASIAGTLRVNVRTYSSSNDDCQTTVTGTIENAGGTVTGTTGTLSFNNGANYIHARSGGTIPTATWAASSTCSLTGLAAGDPNGDAQAFGHLVYNSPSMSGNRNTGGTGLSVAGNLEILNIGTATLQMALTDLAVGGNFILSQGNFRVGDNTNRLLDVGGNVTISGGSLLMSTGGNANDRGTLQVAGNFSQTGGTISENNSGDGLILFDGSAQTFSKTGGTISNTINFEISSGSAVDFGTSVVSGTGGYFTLNGGGKIITSHTSGLRSTGAIGTIQVTGTRTFSSTADYEFKGPVTGIFTTSPTAYTVRNMTINNAGSSVTLSQPLAVTGNLNLQNGEFNTTTTNLITINNNATASGYSNTSFVVGPMMKRGNDNFEFPIGRSGAGLMPVRISSLSGTSDFTAEYKRASPLTVGATISASGLDHLSYCEYWTLNRSGSATANVTLYWNTNSNCNAVSYVNDLSTIVVAHFNGTSWNAYGRNGGTTGTISSGTVTWNNVSSFSPFALGSTTAVYNPLPVLLNGEKAFQKNDNIQIEWSNLTEKSILHYVVQRSQNGSDFVDIGTYLPKSNLSDKADYAALDVTPRQGVSYYRIKVIENTGRELYSKSLRVVLGQSKPVLSLYPNPVTSRQLQVNLAGIKPGKYNLRIVNANGHQLYSRMLMVPSGSFTESLTLPSTVPAGINVLVVAGEGYTENKIFVVQ